MKNFIVIAVVFLGSFLALMAVALLILTVKPEIFGIVASTPKQAVLSANVGATDSVKITSPDSNKVVPIAQVSSVVPDSNGALRVSELSREARNLQIQLDSLKQFNSTKPGSETKPEGDWKATAKLIESMNVEDAGKILKQMKDEEIKQVLARVKKRQAGKILALFEPSRAARILR